MIPILWIVMEDRLERPEADKENIFAALLGVALIAIGLAWMVVRAIGIMPILGIFGLHILAKQERNQRAQIDILRMAYRQDTEYQEKPKRVRTIEKRRLFAFLIAVLFISVLWIAAHNGH